MMARVPGGTFTMGEDRFYPEEGPKRQVEVDGFWIDESPVTVAEFARFVEETGHVTGAEVAPSAEDHPDADPKLLIPGSIVFAKTSGPADLRDPNSWWAWTPGASWRHPEGPGSDVAERSDHPVTHVAFADAEAYAAWASKSLPTEAEWECAARGGLDGAAFAWGEEMNPGGERMANYWRGEFPWQDLSEAGHGTSPVGSYPANAFGLSDMTGNVWEWTSDYFTVGSVGAPKSCCTPRNPRHDDPSVSLVDGEPGAHIPRRAIKGGSHLCSPNYCLRFRPAARQSETVDTSTSHIGFRCILRGEDEPSPI